MSYIETNCLTKDEKILFQPEPCKISIFWAWFWGILGCWLLLIPVFIAIKKTVQLANVEYAITNKKVVEKYGWLRTLCDEMNLDKVENVTISKTMFGNMFNYGTVCVQGTNRNHIYFNSVKNPEQVKKTITDLL